MLLIKPIFITKKCKPDQQIESEPLNYFQQELPRYIGSIHTSQALMHLHQTPPAPYTPLTRTSLALHNPHSSLLLVHPPLSGCPWSTGSCGRRTRRAAARDILILKHGHQKARPQPAQRKNVYIYMYDKWSTIRHKHDVIIVNGQMATIWGFRRRWDTAARNHVFQATGQLAVICKSLEHGQMRKSRADGH